MATTKNTAKKTTPSKKTYTPKKTTVKKTSIVKKDITPISVSKDTKEIGTIVSSDNASKKQTSSIDVLRASISEAKKRELQMSKPVAKKISDIVLEKEEVVKKDVYTNNDFFEEKATYKKSEIVKPTLNENDPKIFSIDDNNSKESAVEKAKRLIDEFNEIKKSPLEQIEKKPATPYKMPEPMVASSKKRGKGVLVFIVFILVLGGIVFFVSSGLNKNKLNDSDNYNVVKVDDSMNTTNVGSNVVMTEVVEDIPTEEIIKPVELVPAIETRKYTIQRGNTLAIIAKNELGDDKRWPTIFSMNESVLISPDNFEPLVEIYIPKDKKAVSSMTESEKKNLYDDYMKVVEYYQKNNKQKEVVFYQAKAVEIYR